MAILPFFLLTCTYALFILDASPSLEIYITSRLLHYDLPFAVLVVILNNKAFMFMKSGLSVSSFTVSSFCISVSLRLFLGESALLEGVQSLDVLEALSEPYYYLLQTC